VTFEDGRTLTYHQGTDADIGVGTVGGSFQPGQIVERREAGGAIGAKDKAGKLVSLRTADVQLDFAVPAVGESWGNTKSPNYLRMMSVRNARKMVLQQLRSIYEKDGAQGLLKALGVLK
jgi:hypothetical protein